MTATEDAGRTAGMGAPLRHGPFRALAAGRLLMSLGNGLANVALAFAVLDVTGSLVHVGPPVALHHPQRTPSAQ